MRLKAELARERAKARKERLEAATRDRKAAVKAKVQAKEATRIRRAPSAYNLFVRDYLKGLRASGKLPTPATHQALKEAFAATATAFKELPAPEKQPYLDRAAAGSAATATLRARRSEERKLQFGTTAYMQYYKESWPLVRAANPGLKMVELSVKIGEGWRALPDAARGKYLDLANADRRARGLKLLAPAGAKAAAATATAKGRK